MRTIFIITQSPEKFHELGRFFADLPDVRFSQKELDLTEIQELDTRVIMEHKLREAARQVHGEFLVDDTSFFIEALNGFPGPLVKWMRTALGPEGIYDLVSRYENKRAAMHTMIGYGNTLVDPPVFEMFEHRVHGTVVEPKTTGYHLDRIFIPDGSTKRFGEMTTDEKNTISHRGVAAKKAREYLKRTRVG
jgi:XTP/dITP diphosphohydrolase